MAEDRAETAGSTESGGSGSRSSLVGVLFGVGEPRNVGGPERLVRFLTGGVLTVVAIYLLAFPVFGFLPNLVVSLALMVGGLYLIYQARVQYCPVNRATGRDSYRGE